MNIHTYTHCKLGSLATSLHPSHTHTHKQAYKYIDIFGNSVCPFLSFNIACIFPFARSGQEREKKPSVYTET